MKLPHLSGQCLISKHVADRAAQNVYESSPNFRRHCHSCAKKEVLAKLVKSFGDDLTLYPTIYPVPAKSLEKNAIFLPPDPRTLHGHDVFIASASSRGRRRKQPEAPALPYPEDFSLGPLRCGNAVLYNLSDSAVQFGFKANRVHVIDMATYHWSGTLKDPRSWAVVTSAAACKIKHLGVWTAGNAGLSLARIVYAVNRFLPHKDRIQVHCYATERALAKELYPVLQAFDAEVVQYDAQTGHTGRIITPLQALEFLNSQRRANEQIRPQDYWDVSDGWDGVALYIYRLLGRQICHYLRPKYLIAPVGTGDLFFGLCLGRRDCINRGLIKEDECELIAAVPDGKDSILTNYKHYRIAVPSDRPMRHNGKSQPPIAPKLATIYTPLLLVLYDAILRKEFRIQRVSRQNQIAAAKRLVSHVRSTIAAEPSAMIAFGALACLADRLKKEQKARSMIEPRLNDDVVVINTGCGVLRNDERKLLMTYLGS